MPTSPSRQEFKHAAHDKPPHTAPPSLFPVSHGAVTVFSNPKDGSVCVCVCVCVPVCVRERVPSKTRSPSRKTAHQVYDRRCCSTRQHSITVDRPSGTNLGGERESRFRFSSPSIVPRPFWHKCMPIIIASTVFVRWISSISNCVGQLALRIVGIKAFTFSFKNLRH